MSWWRENPASSAEVVASNVRFDTESFSPAKLIDNNDSTYWSTDDTVTEAEIILNFDTHIEFNRIVLQEPIKFGQRINEFITYYKNDNDTWELIRGATTVGYKRILVLDKISTKNVKIVFKNSLAPVALSEIGLYNSVE